MTEHTNNECQGTVPFTTAEQAWFWFVDAQEAKASGARFTSGESLYPRPCEPVDILKALDRLYRNRRLTRDHLLVLRHYGRRRMAPDYARPKEARAHHIWTEALDIIEDVLVSKGIVEPPHMMPSKNWYKSAMVWEHAIQGD